MRNHLLTKSENEVPLSYAKFNQLLQPPIISPPPKLPMTARERCAWGRRQMHKLARCGIRSKAVHSLGISLIRLGDITFKEGHGHAIPFTTTNIAFMYKFHSWSQGVKLSSTMMPLKTTRGTSCQEYVSNRPKQQRFRSRQRSRPVPEPPPPVTPTFIAEPPLRPAIHPRSKDTFQVYVKSLEGSTFVLEVEPSENLESVQLRIEALFQVPVQQQRLVFTGKQMADTQRSMSEYGIAAEANIHLSLRIMGGGIDTRSSLKRSQASGSGTIDPIEETSQEPPTRKARKARANAVVSKIFGGQFCQPVYDPVEPVVPAEDRQIPSLQRLRGSGYDSLKCPIPGCEYFARILTKSASQMGTLKSKMWEHSRNFHKSNFSCNEYWRDDIMRCATCHHLYGKRSKHFTKPCRQVPTSVYPEELPYVPQQQGPDDAAEMGGPSWGDFNVLSAQKLYEGGRHKPVEYVPGGCKVIVAMAVGRILNEMGDLMVNADTEDIDGSRLALASQTLFEMPRLLRKMDDEWVETKEIERLFNHIGKVESSSILATQLALRAHLPRFAQVEPRGLFEEIPPRKGDPWDRTSDKVTKLVRQGQFGLAMRKLESFQENVGVVQTTPETLQRLKDLHPQPTNSSPLPAPGDIQHLPFRLSCEDIILGIQELPRGSAGGMSGWTYDLIRDLGTNCNTYINAIMKVFNLILAGQGGDPTLWSTSRLIVLSKSNSGIRPIAIGEAWYRFLGRLVARKIGPSFSTTLLPEQHGASVKGGGEIVCHTIQMFASMMEARDNGDFTYEQLGEEYGSETCMAQLDAANAFNTISRHAIFTALEELSPSLLKLFSWSYGHNANLFFGSGHAACVSATGVRQGDPLGVLYYVLGQNAKLKQLKQEMPAIHIPAYIDDTTVIGQRQDTKAAIPKASRLLGEIDLVLNLTKTTIWDSQASNDECNSTMSGYKIVNDGLTILGNPFGGDFEAVVGHGEHSAEAFLTKKMDKNVEVLGLLSKLPAPIAFFLLKKCINMRGVYLIRTIRPSVNVDHIKRFDTAVDEALAKIVQLHGEIPHDFKIARHLPVLMGGLGLRCLQFTADSAYSASFLQAVPYLMQYRDAWRVAINCLYSEHKDVLGRVVPGFLDLDISGLRHRAPKRQKPKVAAPKPSRYRSRATPSGTALSVSIMDLIGRGVAESTQQRLNRAPPTTSEAAPSTPIDFFPSQKDLQAPVDLLQLKRFLDHLATDPTRQSYLAWMRSGASVGAVQWLNEFSLTKSFKPIQSEQFVENLRMRLGLHLFNDHSKTWRCACSPTVIRRAGMDDFHGLSCGMAGEAQNLRQHNEICEAIMTFFDEKNRKSGGRIVAKFNPHKADTSINVWRPDISVSIGAVTYHLDIARVTPTSKTSLALGSNTTAEVAARQREQSKLNKIAKAIGMRRAIQEGIPIVVEATGRLGVTAGLFFDMINQLGKEFGDFDNGTPMRRLLTRISLIVLTWNAKFQRSARELAIHDNEVFPEFSINAFADEGDILYDENQRPILPPSFPAFDPNANDDVDLGPVCSVYETVDSVDWKRFQSIQDKPPVGGQYCGCESPCSNDAASASGKAACLNSLTYNFCQESTCSQNGSCGNREMTISRSLTEIFYDGAIGWGLRATEDVPPGTCVEEFTGEIMTEAAVITKSKSIRSQSHAAPEFFMGVGRARQGNKVYERIYLDATDKGSKARFINHSCDPNCTAQLWHKPDGSAHLYIVTTELIRECSSFSLSYHGMDYTKGQSTICLCGEMDCTGFVEPRPRRVEPTARTSSLPIGPQLALIPLFDPFALPHQPETTIELLMNRNLLIIWTDGSGPSEAGDPAGWAAIFQRHRASQPMGTDEDFSTEAEIFGPVFLNTWADTMCDLSIPGECEYWLKATTRTNNTAELSAMTEAIYHSIHYMLPMYEDQGFELYGVLIISDSETMIKKLTGNALINNDEQLKFSRDILKRLETKTRVFFTHTRAHAHVPGNERADVLAQLGKTRMNRIGRFEKQDADDDSSENDSLYNCPSPIFTPPAAPAVDAVSMSYDNINIYNVDNNGAMDADNEWDADVNEVQDLRNIPNLRSLFSRSNKSTSPEMMVDERTEENICQDDGKVDYRNKL